MGFLFLIKLITKDTKKMIPIENSFIQRIRCYILLFGNQKLFLISSRYTYPFRFIAGSDGVG